MPFTGVYPQLDGLDIPQPARDAIKRAYDLIFELQAQLAEQRPRTFAFATTVQSIATGATVPVQYNRNSPEDLGGIHKIGTGDDNTQFTIPKPGLWYIASQFKYAGDVTGTYRQLFMAVDGVIQTRSPVLQNVTTPGAVSPTCFISGCYVFNKGQQIRFMANHDAAGAINSVLTVNAVWATLVWLGEA